MARINPHTFTEVPMKSFYRIYANARANGQELRPFVQTMVEIPPGVYTIWLGTKGTAQERGQLTTLQDYLRADAPAPPTGAAWHICGVTEEGMKTDGTMPVDGELGEWKGCMVGVIQGREVGVKGVTRDVDKTMVLDDTQLGPVKGSRP